MADVLYVYVSQMYYEVSRSYKIWPVN